MGASVLNQPVTIVLPTYNFERELRRSVLEVVELVNEFTYEFSIVIVDNGSTDETYETACELACTYPQIKVLRQSVRQGLGRVLEMVRNSFAMEMVVVHDGVSPISIAQLKTVLSTTGSARTDLAAESMREVAGEGTSASRRVASLRTLHNSMEHAHRSLRGFCWIKLEKPLVPRRCREAPSPVVLSQLGGVPTPATPAFQI
jgi:hypothetical protein